MKKTKLPPALLLLVVLAACSGKARIPQVDSMTLGEGSDRVELTRLSDRVWIHTTWFEWSGEMVPSNGLAVITNKGAVLVDTPWTEPQTAVLVDGLAREFKSKTVKAIISHAHPDRCGGIAELHRRGIETLGTALTGDLAEEQGYERPTRMIPPGGESLPVGGTTFEIWFPGSGHTADNLVVWLPKDKILFGGCLVKELAARSPGNTADAVMSEWGPSIRRLSARYPDAATVVPGHGLHGGRELLAHTEKLVE
jgi:metallo-beta-lactamase class B